MPTLYPLPMNLKFLFYFDICSFALWVFCFCRFLILFPLVGRLFLPEGIADFFHVISLSPLLTFLLRKSLNDQEIKRRDIWPFMNGIRMAILCYGVIFRYPRVARHASYAVLISSWCITYIIHFAYYSFKVKTRRFPYWLFWLQFNNYYITFVVSVLAEMIIVFISTGLSERNSKDELFLGLFFLLYVPGSYFYWKHLRERREKRFLQVKKKLWSAHASNVVEHHAIPVTSQAQFNTESIELRNID